MKIFFYGKLADAVGKEIEIPANGLSSVGSLKRQLAVTYPAMAVPLQNGRVKALVGETFVGDDHPLSPGDEVEFLAPVSGG
jgi:molybdopterin converting factor small subunit